MCPECCSALSLQFFQILPCDPPPPWPPLTSCCGPHPIPDDDAGLQDHTLRESTSFFYISGPAGTAITESKQSCSVRSRLFSVLEPQWWNELLTNVRTAGSLTNSMILRRGLFFLLTPSTMMLWFLSFDKCTYCKLLWIKASAKC